MSANKKLTIRYISKKTLSAIVATNNGHFYKTQFPYTTHQKTEKIDSPPISSSFSEENLHKNIFPRLMLVALSEMNDLFVKINNGSIDILDAEQYKELMLEKIRNNIFLLEVEGKSTLVQWLSLSFICIDYKKDDVSEIIDIIDDASADSRFVLQLYKRFGRFNKEKFTNKLIDEILPTMKEEGKWKALRQATFIIYFMARDYAKDRCSEARSEYESAIEQFERNTGIDANYNSLQRHTDRFTRNQHFNSKRSKQKKLGKQS